MSYERIVRRVPFVLLVVVFLFGPVPRAAGSPGPSFEYPQNGQVLDQRASYMFKVRALYGAQGYLWGFFQNGVLVWENLRDEGILSPNAYSITAGSTGHRKFTAGDLLVMVRAQVNYRWTDATSITVRLESYQTPSRPVFEYPQNGQTLDRNGSLLFKVRPISGAQGYLWGFFQNGVMVWENLRDEGRLSSNIYSIVAGTAAHRKLTAGALQVMVRAQVNYQWTEAASITVNLRTEELPPGNRVPILQLAYYPTDPRDPGYLDASETGWSGIRVSDMQAATEDMVRASVELISEATRYHGYKDAGAPRFLEYFILEEREFFRAMPRGYPLGGSAYRPHYGQILRELNVCDYVDNLGVKEVWIYGYHSNFIVPDESKMSSKYGDISNALPKDESIPQDYRLPRCGNSYVMYNFTYQPGGAGAIGNSIHNRLHQIENVIFFTENRGYPPNDSNVIGSLFWDDFSVYGNRGTLPGYRASCGNTHSPPNTNAGYDYGSPQYRLNNCETWHPDDSQTTYVYENCTQWGCTNTGFYKWFMQNLPGYKNGILYGGRQMRNWWEAMYNFNQFIDKGRSLYQ